MQKTIKFEMLVALERERERESYTLVNKKEIEVINKDKAKTYKK